MIVTAIAGNKAYTQQLIPDYSSPHNYSFKPSDIRKIKKASLIFRIDEHFESIISPALEKYSPKDRLISLVVSEGIHLLPLSGKHSHSHDKEENKDLHVWASPENAIVMAKNIAQQLIKYDKRNAKTYQKNLEVFEAEVLRTSALIKAELLPIKDKPYIVFNNSWQYFVDYFELKDAIIINSREGQAGNIKSIQNTRKKIKLNNIGCVFSDPSVKTSRIKTLIENMSTNTVEIDVLASQTPVKHDAYSKWLASISTRIKECLGNH